MKKILIVLCAASILMFAGCPTPTTDTGSDDPDKNPTDVKYSKELRGEWIRMDTGERWYISGNTIKINGTVSNKNVTMTKTAKQVITVKESGRSDDYFLFASRVADASFSARVVFVDNYEKSSETGKKVSRDYIGGAGQRPPVRIRNPGQPEDPPIVVVPDPVTGEIEVPGIIPGDPVEIIPDDPEWDNIKVGLTPWDKQDMGIIPLTEGLNLKSTIRMNDSNDDISMLYADGVSHDFVIEVENIGEVNCVGASYELSINEDDFILTSGVKEDILDTIVPGGKRQIPLSLGAKLIDTGYEIKNIGVKVGSYDTENEKYKTWEDQVPLTYYKQSVPIRIRSEKPVQGVIKAPRGETYYFKTSAPSYSYSIGVPWSSEDYIISFLGATVGSETRYSLAVDEQAPSNWTSLLGPDLFLNEPLNNNRNTAPEMNLADKRFMGYLHEKDIDYYRINMGDTPPEVKLVGLEGSAARDLPGNYWDNNANPGDTVNLDVMFRNYSQETRTLTMTGLSADAAYAPYVTDIIVPSSSHTLPPQHYGSLSSDTTSLLYEDVSMLNSPNIDRVFQFRLAPNCPPGTVNFTVTFKDHLGLGYVSTVAVEVVKPPIVIELDSLDDVMYPGGTLALTVGAKNTGTEDAYDVTAKLLKTGSSYDNYLSINNETASYGTLVKNGPTVNAVFNLSLLSSCPAGVTIPLRVEFTNVEGNKWYGDLNIYVSPPSPVNVQALAVSETSIRVSWAAVDGATDYKVYDSNDTLITSLGNITQYDHTGLASGTLYNYRISALVAGEESIKSQIVSARTWERLVFNRQFNNTASGVVPHYYRFYVTSGLAYLFESNVLASVNYTVNESGWSDLSAGATLTAEVTGWATIRFNSAYSFRLTSPEAAVSGFSVAGSAGNINETDKTITVNVPLSTNLGSLTPSVTPASGWTCTTSGAKNFNAPVEYTFTKGDAAQVYTVTVIPNGEGGIIVNPPPIDDITIEGFPAALFTLSRNGTGGTPKTQSVTLTGSGYTSIEWYVGETDKTSAATNDGKTFIVDAAAYTLGTHTLTVIVFKDGVPYSNEVDFKVVQ